jgi:hypothetical protein
MYVNYIFSISRIFSYIGLNGIGGHKMSSKRILKDSYKTLSDIKSACHDYVAKHKRNGVCIEIKTEYQPEQRLEVHFMCGERRIHTEKTRIGG